MQPSQYKHIAAYPENLVLNLLEMVTLNDSNTILDMFAGSGTTLKVVKDLNESILFNNKLNAIMIESNLKYIDIIIQRCNLNNINIEHYEFVKYDYSNINDNKTFYQSKNQIDIKIDKNGFFKIFDKKEDFYNFLSYFYNNKIKNYLELNATCFIGSKEFDIYLIYNVSSLNEQGWIIRNLLVVENNNKWFPVFMIIDDNKKQKNLFNFKNLDLKHKTNENTEWTKFDFIGYKVLYNLSKNKLSGLIIEIIEKYHNGLPKYVLVKWENELITKEFVINSQEEINNNIKITKDKNNNINVEEDIELTNLNNLYADSYNFNDLLFKINKKEYNGKYKDEKRFNWGASPGARASNEDIYFSKQRLYEVDQQLIADYLNNLRIKRGLSKKQLIDFFPENYYHTVGHWLRKDFGGSIPLPEDWELLLKYLEIDEGLTNYVCKTALKIQTVKKGEYKLPKDFVESSLLNRLECLIK